MAPAAIYSTTLIPKCSSVMEWMPATAPAKSPTKSLLVEAMIKCESKKAYS